MKETSQQTGENIAMAEIGHTIVDIPESASDETNTPKAPDDAVIEMIESVAEEITAMLENGDVAIEIPESAAAELGKKSTSWVAGLTAGVAGVAGIAASTAMAVALKALVTKKETVAGADLIVAAATEATVGTAKVLAAIEKTMMKIGTPVAEVGAIVKDTAEAWNEYLTPSMIEIAEKEIKRIAKAAGETEIRTAAKLAVKGTSESLAEMMPEVAIAEGLPIWVLAASGAAAAGATIITGLGIAIAKQISASKSKQSQTPSVVGTITPAIVGAVLGAAASAIAGAALGTLTSAALAAVTVRTGSNVTTKDGLAEMIAKIATKSVVEAIEVTARGKLNLESIKNQVIDAGMQGMAVAVELFKEAKNFSAVNGIKSEIASAGSAVAEMIIKSVNKIIAEATAVEAKHARTAIEIAAATDIKMAIVKATAKTAPLALTVPVTVITAGLTVAIGAVAITTAAVVAKRRADQKINQEQALVQDSELGRGIETGIRPAQQDMPVATIQMENEVMPTSSRRNSNASQASESIDAGQPANKNLDLMGQSLVMPIEKTGTAARSDIAVKEPKKEQSPKPAKNKRL